MKVLLHSYNFYPMVGGIETVSETLADYLIEAGIECTVVSQTPSGEESDKKFNFPLVRNPSFIEKYKLAKRHDVIFSNGTSLNMVLFAFLANKPFCWSLQTYQLMSIDGAGWSLGKPTPMKPTDSLKYYLRSGMFLIAIKGYIKLLIRRFIANYFCKANVAITQWVANRTSVSNKVIIYNPFPLTRFQEVLTMEVFQDLDFIFLGRFVSEKGVDILLKALSMLVKENDASKKITLGLIGDGPDRERLENIVLDLDISQNVIFMGKKTGQDLLKAVARGKIAVVPSSWEEPMGGVALELLAAGKNIIVSENGGLAELIEDAGMTFQNGDPKDLKEKMQLLLNSKELREVQQAKSRGQLNKFDEKNSVNAYIKLFEHLTSTEKPKIPHHKVNLSVSTQSR